MTHEARVSIVAGRVRAPPVADEMVMGSKLTDALFDPPGSFHRADFYSAD
jgi:hypothetical protein